MPGYKSKVYVVTAAQYSAPVNKEFYAALEVYCKKHGAELVLKTMAGKTVLEVDLDPLIASHPGLTFREKNLNDKCKVSNHNVRPQQIDPVTGLGRFTQSDVTTFFASSKQRFKVIPNSNESLPKVLMTTGALTHPNYSGDRIGKIAEKDHTYGAVVVEIVSDTLYHYRLLTANKNGEFVDLGVKYKEKGTEPCDLEALVLGDWHVGDTDPEVRKATLEMIQELKPKRVVLHDYFNGHSVNHHEEYRRITRAITHAQGRASLEEELKACTKELLEISEVVGEKNEIVIVRSNHDDFLEKYLQEGKYIDEDLNWRIGHELALACYDPKNKRQRTKNPLKEGLERYGGIPKNVKFHERDLDYKVLGWQLGAHGDKGPGGRRSPSAQSLENAYGKSITGHKHTPEILRNTFVVGTSTYLTLSYTAGPSSWMNTHAMLWANGRLQLVNIINGEWRKK